MASIEEDNTTHKIETIDQPKESVTPSASGNENFLVIDMAPDSGDDSDKDAREVKMEKKDAMSDIDNDNEVEAPKSPPPESAKPASANPRIRKKPKAPVVDVTCLRKRKWQLKVYPLHTDDLQLNYHLCKLASESLLYIPSEGRHGKAELYVATQKDTGTIIGKLLRMEFHHDMLSIEVVRKDTGGKEDGEDSKKECKAFLMFDKFLSKKIFDAKFEKGTHIEKIVTLTKLPKEATKDFIGALFPFSTDIEVFDNDDIEERKAVVTCKTPVTALLVYKSFKRLEINDVHVKISVDDSVKAIKLPPIFFTPPDKNSESTDQGNALNKSSLQGRRPLLTSINQRAMMVKKRALVTRRKPGMPGIGPPLLRTPKGLMTEEEMMGGPGGPRRHPGDGRWPMDPNRPPRPGGPRGMPGRPGRMGDRNRDRDSSERGRRRSEDSQVTKEMLQLQNQLNQAIKNQLAMLNTSQHGGGPMHPDMPDREGFGGAGGPNRTPLLGPGPRQFGSGGGMGGPNPRGGPMDHDMNKGLLGQAPRMLGGGMSNPQSRKRDQMEFGGNSWSGDRGNRMDRDRQDRDRNERPDRPNRSDRMDRSGGRDRSNDRDRNRDRPDRTERNSSAGGTDSRSHRLPQSYAADGARANKGERSHNSTNVAIKTERGSSRRPQQRNESFSAGNNSSNRFSGSDFTETNDGGDNNSSYYRRY